MLLLLLLLFDRDKPSVWNRYDSRFLRELLTDLSNPRRRIGDPLYISICLVSTTTISELLYQLTSLSDVYKSIRVLWSIQILCLISSTNFWWCLELLSVITKGDTPFVTYTSNIFNSTVNWRVLESHRKITKIVLLFRTCVVYLRCSGPDLEENVIILFLRNECGMWDREFHITEKSWIIKKRT